MIFKHILVPLDGSRFAEAALPYAILLAKSAPARLHLVLAHEPALAVVGMGEALPPPDLGEEARAREKQYLAETAGELILAGNPVEFRAPEGPAGPAICEEAGRISADLVVMSTHGRGAIGRLWLGGVADHVVRHLSSPILLVHGSRKGEAPPTPALHSILVPLDLSQDAQAILQPVCALACLSQGHVTLLHVVEPLFQMETPSLPYPLPLDPAFLEKSREQAQKQLDQLADRLRERGVSVSTRISTGATAATGLLEALEEARFDLIAMTTHGAGGLRRLLLGSVADKVIRGATKPVLVVRPESAVH